MKAVVAALLLLTYGDGPRPSLQIVRHYDLAFLTHKQAWELTGRRIVCRVDLDSRPEERAGYTVYNCASPDDTYRTVWLHEGEQAEDTRTVEATLHLRYVPHGKGFDGFWKFWLVVTVRKERPPVSLAPPFSRRLSAHFMTPHFSLATSQPPARW
jgi:hypothetical protein